MMGGAGGEALEITAAPTEEPVPQVGVRWYLREKQGKLYLVKAVFEGGRRREEWLGNVEVIEQVMAERKKQGPRPYRKRDPRGEAPRVEPPAGFEPATTGLQGRRCRPRAGVYR